VNYLEKYEKEISHLCRLANVRTLYAFGSVLTDKFNEKSDIDMIVDIDEVDPLVYTDKYFSLLFAFQSLFNRHVDLLEERAIRNPYFRKNIESHKSLIYGH
jgi:predicted nucleotidyltransferase